MVARSYSSSQQYRFGYNGKELDSEGMCGSGATYDYGFRIYNPNIAKFLSVDPLSKSYPMLTPYQFASNSPISGIDQDGLEYLNNEDARVEIIGGEVHVKVENCSHLFQSIWNQRILSGQWTPGYIGLSTLVTDINPEGLKIPKTPDFFGVGIDNATNGSLATGDPSRHIVPAPKPVPIAKSTGLPNKSYTQQKTLNGGAMPGVRFRSVGAGLAINILISGLQTYGQVILAQDRDLISQQTKLITDRVFEDLAKAIDGGYILPKYMNMKDLGFIANVILTGENKSNDPEILAIGTKILKEISKNADGTSVYKQPMTTHDPNTTSTIAPAESTSQPVQPILDLSAQLLNQKAPFNRGFLI